MFEGFTSDLHHTVKQFTAELERCHEALDDTINSNYPHRIVEHVTELCRQHQVEDLLERELAVLLNAPKMILH